jgi:predicted dehydrogenase
MPMALAALEAGCHVLIEKPFSHSWEGVDELLEACSVSDRQSAVAYVYHAHPVLAAARDCLRSGEIGPVRQVTVHAGQPFSDCGQRMRRPITRTDVPVVVLSRTRLPIR